METVKVLKETEDATIYRVLVTPFGSPERKDLHGEFFHAETDFGDNIGVNVKYAMYEHLMNAKANPHMPSDKQIIGKATFAEVDEWGRWFDFEVKRALEYHDYIRQLVDLGLMGASSQAYSGGKSLDASVPGKINRWIESEVSMTPTPASPDTIGKIHELAKSFNLVGEDGRLRKTVISVTIDPTPAPVPAPVQEDEKKDEEPAADLASEIDQIFNEGENPAGVLEEIKSLLVKQGEEIQNIKSGFNMWLELWGYGEDDDPRTVISSLLGLPDNFAKNIGKLDEILKEIGNTQKGITTFAKNVRNVRLTDAVQEWNLMSDAERKAAQKLDNGGNKPNPAPQRPAGFAMPDKAPGGN